MPGKDGTGPLGQGPIAGAGRGQGAGGGMGQGGRGRMGGAFSAGPGGECICPGCDYKIAHVAGQPCSDKKCPKCGAKLIRG
jgi:uncharacterized protein